MSNVWQTGGLGPDALSGLQNQINSVVHRGDYSFPGGLLWNTSNHGAVEITDFAEEFSPHAPFPNSIENPFIQNFARLF